MFEGFKEYFKKLLPLDSEIVLSHNDGQENNILTSFENPVNIMIIDYEYIGW